MAGWIEGLFGSESREAVIALSHELRYAQWYSVFGIRYSVFGVRRKSADAFNPLSGLMISLNYRRLKPTSIHVLPFRARDKFIASKNIVRKGSV